MTRERASNALDAVVLQVAQRCEQGIRGNGVENLLAEVVYLTVVAVQRSVIGDIEMRSASESPVIHRRKRARNLPSR